MMNMLKCGAVALAIALGLTGCDWLFGPRVRAVAPDDLASYTAGSLVAQDEASVIAATMEALAGSDGAGGAGAAFIAILEAPEFQGQLDDIDATVAPAASLIELMKSMINSGVEQARSVVLAGEIDDDLTDGTASGTINILITDETVDAAFGGTATVERFYLDASGSMELDEVNEFLRIEGRFEHDASIAYDDFNADGIIVIHDGQINSEGDGNGDVTVEGDDVSVFWQFGYALSAGFSFSNLATETGGKLIVEFRYSGRERFAFNLNDDIDAISDDATDIVEAELLVQLYDNANELVFEHTFTDEELYALFVLL